MHKIKAQIRVKYFLISLLVIFFSTTIFQGVLAYKVWSNSSQVHKDQSRDEVLSVMKLPSHGWVKASSHDIWVRELLLGGVKIDILYNGDNCDLESYMNIDKSCKVSDVFKNYYTLWGNNWFLAYAP